VRTPDFRPKCARISPTRRRRDGITIVDETSSPSSRIDRSRDEAHVGARECRARPRSLTASGRREIHLEYDEKRETRNEKRETRNEKRETERRTFFVPPFLCSSRRDVSPLFGNASSSTDDRHDTAELNQLKDCETRPLQPMHPTCIRQGEVGRSTSWMITDSTCFR